MRITESAFFIIRKRHALSVRASDFLNRNSCIGWIDIAYSLLNRVQLSDLLKDEIQVHVRPFCEAHGLLLDDVLLGYIYDNVRALSVLNFCFGILTSVSPIVAAAAYFA